MPNRTMIGACALALAIALSGCSSAIVPAATATPPLPTATPNPPTPTPEPLAARVNGRPILLADFEAEVQRYESAQTAAGTNLASLDAYQQQVLDALIDLELLAQAAADQGATVSDEELSAQLDQLAADQGGSEAVGAWLAANDYDLDSFQRSLRRELLAQQTVERLSDSVADQAEQVHARHILVGSQSEAEEILTLLSNGADFGQLAVERSLDLSTRVGGGDLGWFPRGILNQPAVEQAAFGLQPGEISSVVESDLGYHVIEVLERGPRQLSDNDQRQLRQAAVESWLNNRRESASMEVLIEP
ncbi:MAG: peptidylprolyl isomerase [Anaerolineales bacterium]